MEAKFIENLKESLEMYEIEVKLSDRFRDYEDWSSLKELSVLALLASEYGVELEMKEFSKLMTVGDLLEFTIKHGK